MESLESPAPGAMPAPEVPEAPEVPGALGAAPGGLSHPPPLAPASAGIAGQPPQPEVLQRECSDVERRKYEETRAKLAKRETEKRSQLYQNRAAPFRDPETRTAVAKAKACAKLERANAATGAAEAEMANEPEGLDAGQAEAEGDERMGEVLGLLPSKSKSKSASGGARRAKAKAREKALAEALARGDPPPPPPGRGRPKGEIVLSRPRRSRVSLPCAPSLPEGAEESEADSGAPAAPGAPGAPEADRVPGVESTDGRRARGTVQCFAGRPPPASAAPRLHFDRLQAAFLAVLPEGANPKDGTLQRTC